MHRLSKKELLIQKRTQSKLYWKNERYLQSHRLYLIHIEFNINQRHPLVHLIVMFNNTVNSFWHIFKHQIEVKLFLISHWAEVMLQAYNIWVIKNLHCLQLTVLVSHILKNFLYSYSLTSFQTPGLLIVISKNIKTQVEYESYGIEQETQNLCVQQLTWKTTPNEPCPTIRSAM